MDKEKPFIQKEVPKRWGKEIWIENNELYCGKLLELRKKHRCSFHRHKIKDETFYILKGLVQMGVGDEVLLMREGDSLRIKPGTWHSFYGFEDSIIIEFSTHHDDADTYYNTEPDINALPKEVIEANAEYIRKWFFEEPITIKLKREKNKEKEQ